ncbi:MAG TPA: Hsp70 family protein, partial [Phycicoccus sp.]|nr:Hsp70 family protein [Phycicoccus sp.]
MHLGLDFGTTFTVVAHVDRGNYPVVSFYDADGEAHDRFPSVVAQEGDALVFGFAAVAAAPRGAPLVRSFKRALADPGVQADSLLRVGSLEVPMLELLVGYFTAVREALATSSTLEGTLGDECPRTVLGIPAQAHSAQRLLTIEGCRRAGFDVVALVNEPSAASFEFAHRQARSISSRRNVVVVYDLGGGTFDASLVSLEGTSHEVLDSFGINRLGGDDIDEAFARAALRVAGAEPAAVPGAAWEALIAECRDAKERLTPQTRRVAIEVPGTAGGDDPDEAPTTLVTVPVTDLNGAATPLVEATIEAMTPLLPDEETLDGVAGIYLVGGASALPLVPRLLRERFGRRVHRSPLPSASTAVGLAIVADPEAGFSLTDRLSRGFGVFREMGAGEAISFDPLLDRRLVHVRSEAGAATGSGADEEVVITRRYQAAHNVGWFRFVEYSTMDADGVPRGDLSPRGEIVFPFEDALQADSDDAAVRGVPVERRGEGHLIEERYAVSPSGIIAATITDLTTGYRQEARLAATA